MSDDVLTLWVRLKGADRDQAAWMREKEKRSYASLLRIALAYYYESVYANAEDDAA